MNNLSFRKFLTCTMVVVFFLTSIPYGHANQSAPPITYEQVKMMEILKALKLDQESLSQTDDRSRSLAEAHFTLLPSEFDDVKAFLANKLYSSGTQETFKTAVRMTADRINPAKVEELRTTLGITDHALELTASLIKENVPKKSDLTLACKIFMIYVLACLILIVILVSLALLYFFLPFPAIWAVIGAWSFGTILACAAIVQNWNEDMCKISA
ncbi:MAG: hypothetical protein CSYNP_04014 [Syntrophus sp. SKADARSKE-3]|nr:hypothetical protein [Syntrophus sp. SKADARSKE-3]